MDGATGASPKAEGDVILGPVTVPLPKSISEQARAYLATPFWAAGLIYPDGADVAAWKAVVEEVRRNFAPVVEGMHAQSNADVEKTTMGGVTVYVGTPRGLPAGRADKAHIYIHGGGWALLGGEACGGQAAVQATKFGVKTYSVDYRSPPEFRFPAALDDCLAVYVELLKSHNAGDIVISGSSAGGNLSAALALRIRDAGLPAPAGVALLTPCSDAARLSDTFIINDQLDTVLSTASMSAFWDVYAGSHDRTDPYLSPVYADYSGEFPPVFLQTGTRDVLLSDTVRLHRAMRRGGVKAELHVWEAMPHGGFDGLSPEDAEVNDEIQSFFERCWGA